MTARWIATFSMAAVGFLVLACPGSGPQVWAKTPSQPHYALTAGEVARAFMVTFPGHEVQISERQVSLLAEVVATDPNPVLDIKSVEPLGARPSDRQRQPQARSKVRVACHQPGVCLPFYAIVSWPGGNAFDTSHEFSASRAISTLKPNRQIIMRAGAHATLVMEDDRAHIQLSVISLENGIAGDRIRVASPDRKQVYVAAVVSANLLKGRF